MTAYVASVYLHILAAATWVGGIIFLVAIAVPALRKLDKTAAEPMLRATVFRFRAVGWVAFGVLLLTGLYNLHMRGIGWAELTDPAYRATSSGKALIIKLGCFAVLLVLQGIHDFSIGPRALAAMEKQTGEAPRLRKQAGMIGRINGLITLVIVLCAVIIVRGC